MTTQIHPISLEDSDAITIELNEEQRRCFAWGDLEGFAIVWEDEDESYKDSAPVYVVAQRKSDGSYWEFNWSKHTSHYGHGEHSYNMESNIRRVNKVEKVVTQTIVDWVRITK